mmetsp:Transcript_23110/g.17529  ORF Transcript_23110/g.17529 Transcript_23110/m.17529 type:complete len:96 (+) Transcript_23110:10-297(+)
MRTLITLTSSLALASALAREAGKLTIDPVTRQFKDEAGRSVLLHGVNAVYKQDPYIPSDASFHPQESLNDEDIDNLVEWGFNFMRLGVMWEAVER